MMFVNWREVNALFCGLIWMVALVLVLVILAHAVGPSTPVHHPPRYYPGLDGEHAVVGASAWHGQPARVRAAGGGGEVTLETYSR
jgi:hypothetical protein